MISFLASPKAFQGIAKGHQYRAIESWRRAADGAEVILYGDSAGIDEAGRNLGARVVKHVACSPSGIPYFGAIAEHAAVHARHDLQVYLNCDLSLFGILAAMRQVRLPRFLLIGQRINLDKGLSVDMGRADWKTQLRRLAQQGKATLHGPTGMDYFGFRRGLWRDLPPVVIGRAGYDNALLAYCLRHGVPLVDATLAVAALHPCHDYGHVQGGWQAVWHGRDARNNLRHAGKRGLAEISDADYVLSGPVVRNGPGRQDRLRRLELAVRHRRNWPRLALAVRLAWRGFQWMGMTRVVTPTLAEVIEALEFQSCE